MKKAMLGDIAVSRICIGCWSYGGGEGSYWGPQAQADVDAAVAAALSLGINFFDTAFVYNNGESEKALGHALAGRRAEAVICDKTPIIPREKLSQAYDFIADGCRRLGTDYIDILMIHWPTKDRELLIENLQALEEVRKSGLVRALGVSNFGVETLRIARDLGLRLVADELAYNLITRAIEFEILPECLTQGIGVTAYMPLMQGILSGKYAVPADIPDERRRSYHFRCADNPKSRHGGEGFEEQTMAAVRGIGEIAQGIGTDAATAALAWTLAKKGVASAMVGCRNAAQVERNAAAASFALPPEAEAALDALTLPLRDVLPRTPDLFAPLNDSRVW